MSQKLPYLPSPGTVPKVLDKIIEAKTPERFTIDFLGTKLGFKGGSSRPIIPLLKRLGFLQDDGTPTDLYKRFRTESGRGAAMAEALRSGYGELYERNEYIHDAERKVIKDIVYEITGAEKGNTASESIVATFCNLREYADFDAEDMDIDRRLPVSISREDQNKENSDEHGTSNVERRFGLSYTININLPETTDVAVYNAIFEAIDGKLLK